MKRKLALTLVFSIVISSLSANCLFAGTTTKKAVTVRKTESEVAEIIESKKVTLTVDEATERAINYSHDLKNLADEQDLAEENESDARRDLFYATEYSDITSLSVQFKNLTNTIANYDKNTTLQKDKIRLSVVNLFTAIIEAEDNIELQEKSLALSEENLKISETKLKLGLISQTDYDSEKLSYTNAKASLQTLRNALDSSYTNLSKIMGDDLATTYSVSLDVEYTPVDRTINLADKVTHDTGTSLKVKEAEDSVTVAKYSYNVYSSLYSNEKQESVRNTYNKAVRNLETVKTNLEANVKSIYNNIVDLETAYDTNASQLAKLKSDLEIKKTQLELGKITQLDYDNAEYEIEKLEYTMKHQVYSHNVLMMQFENIDLSL
jgi:outer membrane protein TolC